jgi:hypothetical protein
MKKATKFVLLFGLFILAVLPAWAVSPSITGNNTLLATQKITHPATVKSAAVDISGKFQINVTMNHVPVEATAMTNPPVFDIQVTNMTVGSNNWFVLPGCSFTPSVVTASTEILSETEPVGEVNIVVPTPGDFDAGDLIFIENTTLASSEWNSVQEIGAQTVVLDDGLVYSQQSDSAIWEDREDHPCVIGPGWTLMRAKFSSEGATCGDSAIRATYSTFDSVQ